MPLDLPNGIGASLGDSLVTNKPLRMSGTPRYVSSVLGSDANSGESRKDPKATLASALTASSNGDWIVLAADHTETYTSALSISTSVTIVAEGLVTAEFINNSASASLFTVDTTDVQLINIDFAEQLQTNSAPLITCDQARFLMRGCVLSANGSNNAALLQLNTGAGDCRIDATGFISTSLAQSEAGTNDPPTTGLEVTAAMSDLHMTGTVFNGGPIGWTDYAFKASTAAMTRLRATGMSFLLGADYALHADSTGYLHIGVSTGDVIGSW